MDIKVPKGVELVSSQPTTDDATYKISCQCGCSTSLSISTDYPHDVYITMETYRGCFWQDKWYQRLWCRIKGAIEILMRGEIKTAADIVIDSPDKLQNLSYLLQQVAQKFAEKQDDYRRSFRRDNGGS